MSFDIITTSLIGVISSSLSALISWFLARRKYNSEVDESLIHNMQESLNFYKSLVDDNKERLAELLKRNDALEEEIKDLRNQMFEIVSNLCFNLTCQHRQLTKELKSTKTKK